MIIQANLKWNAHIKVIQNKISKSIGIISKAKYMLSNKHLKQLYQTLIEPYINYCCIIWSSPIQNTALEKLCSVEKRAIRFFTHSVARAHTKPLFYTLNLLDKYDLCQLQIVLFVYKAINGIIQSRYSNLFTLSKKIHSYSIHSYSFLAVRIIDYPSWLPVNWLESTP